MRLAEIKGEHVELRALHSTQSHCKYCSSMLGKITGKPTIWEKYNLTQWAEHKSYVPYDPPQIARWAIQQYSGLGDIVFDPFMGNGTTLVEAINNDRRAIGLEIDKEVYHVASNNLKLNREQGATSMDFILNAPAASLWRFNKWQIELTCTHIPTKRDITLIDPDRKDIALSGANLSVLDRLNPNAYWERLAIILDHILENTNTFVFAIRDTKDNYYHETINEFVESPGMMDYVGQVHMFVTTRLKDTENFYRIFVWRKL